MITETGLSPMGIAPPPVNPIIGEIDQAHQALSPEAQDAIGRAHGILGIQPPAMGSAIGAAASPAPATPAPAEAPAGIKAPPMGLPGMVGVSQDDAMAGRSEDPLPPIRGMSRGLAPSFKMPPPDQTPRQAELTRLTTHTPGSINPETGKIDVTKDQSGSGIAQIKNPFLRTLGRIGDAALSTFLPAAAVFTPGTQLHHQMVVNSARNAEADEQEQLNNEAKRQQEAATAAHTEAETGAIPATTEHTKAQTEALIHPTGKIKDEQLLYDKNGTPIGYRDEKGKFYGPDDPSLPPGVKDVIGAASSKNAPLNVHVLPDGKVISVNTDPKTGEHSVKVMYEGDPKVQSHVIERNVGGKAHSVLVNSQTGADIKDLGETGYKPPTVNVNAGVSALDRESTHFGAPHQKAVDAANAQLEKITEARSMLTTGTAESQALAVPKVLTALVSGAGSGVRITQAELEQIARARGIVGDIQGWFSRITGNGKLTEEQRNQLVGVLDDATKRLSQKRQIANDALTNINGAKTREEMIQHDKTARDKLAEFENGGVSAVDPNVKAYADQYYGGDVAKAQAAIAGQKKK